MPGFSLVRGTLIAAILTLGVLATLSGAFAAEDASPANGKLVVHVVDGSGSPQVDAAVRLFIRNNVSRLLTDTGREIQSDASGRAIFDHLATDQFYFLRAVVGGRLLSYHGTRINSDEPTREIQLSLSERRSAIVHVHDEQGKPIAGATVSDIRGKNAKAFFGLDWPDLPKVGIIAGPSNAAGELTLEGLPDGILSLHLRHPTFAPASIDNLATTPGSVNNVAMSPGAIVELRFRLSKGVSQVENLTVFWSDEGRSEVLPPVFAGGTVALAVKPGKYTCIYVKHPDFAVTPEFYHKMGKQFELRSGVNEFTFDVRKKAKVHGRVLDQSTGKPLAGIRLEAYAVSDKIDGPFADFAWPLTSTDDCATGPRGDYELRIPAGPSLVCMSSDGRMAQNAGERISVAADGSTVVPDILVRRIPKVHGIVRDPQGRPVPWAVVRFRDSQLTFGRNHPALADLNGRFELSLKHIPEDRAHEQLQTVQTILAFDPYRPLGAVARVDLSGAEPLTNLELRLEPQDFSFPVTGFPRESTDFGCDLSPADRETFAGMARGGMPAPALDGAAWLNTAKPKMSLADFRGKFVLLHFWTTWCGSCKLDFPCLASAEKLFQKHGLVIIFVHDNSVPASEIKQYVADYNLHYPVVIDQPDGRILAAYKPHGAFGYPTDVLVGPDGRIVGYPSDENRVTYHIELLRQELMSQIAVPAAD